MEWFEILKQMKADSGMTTLEISEKSGVPEPTLEKLFSGFTKNPKLNTIIAVTHSLGRTLDDLAPLISTVKNDLVGDEMKYIGTALKSERIKSGKSVKDALRCLINHAIKVTESTIYNWENDISMPNADQVLILCNFYGVKDVMEAFGYKPKKSSSADEPEDEDYDKTVLIENYDEMNAIGKKELVKYSRLLANSGEYKKCGKFGVDKGTA